MRYSIPAHDPSGTIKNFKVNRTRGPDPRVYFYARTGPPALPGSRPAFICPSDQKRNTGPPGTPQLYYYARLNAWRFLLCRRDALRGSTRRFYTLLVCLYLFIKNAVYGRIWAYLHNVPPGPARRGSVDQPGTRHRPPGQRGPGDPGKVAATATGKSIEERQTRTPTHTRVSRG